MSQRYLAIVVVALAAFSASALRAETLYSGPILAEIKRIVDGDTLIADAYIWPNTRASDVALRVRGIDTPELRGKCERERRLAAQAAEAVKQAFKPGQLVFLYQVETGKYGGRFLAQVRSMDGLDWAGFVRRQGLAASYEGRGAKQDWCAPSSTNLIRPTKRKGD